MKKKSVKAYVAETGKCPYEERANGLSKRKKSLVSSYIDKVSRGGSKNNIRSLKEGLFEIKISSEGGLRVYFGEDGNSLILLLIGGDKGSQKRDIIRARNLWSEYGKQK